MRGLVPEDWFWDHWWTDQRQTVKTSAMARALGPVEEKQGLQLSPGVQRQSPGLSRLCQPQGVRAFLGWGSWLASSSACRPSAVSADGSEGDPRLCPGQDGFCGDIRSWRPLPPPLGEQAVGRRPPLLLGGQMGRCEVPSWDLHHGSLGQCRASWEDSGSAGHEALRRAGSHFWLDPRFLEPRR